MKNTLPTNPGVLRNSSAFGKKNTSPFKGLLALFLMVMGMGVSWGQTTIVFNGAESSGTTWTTSANTYTASTTNTGTPAERIKTGTQSYQKAGGFAQLITNSASTAGYTDCFVELWNASISTTTGNGIDSSEGINIFVSNTTTFPSIPDVTIVSSVANVRFGMSGTSVITTTAGTPVTKTYSTGGTLTGSNAFSKVVINIPNNWTSVYLKVESTTDGSAEIICIDDVALKGTLAAAAPEINIKQATTSYATASTFAFGNQVSGTSSTATTFTIENTGNAALNLSGSPKVAISGTNASEFTINQTSTASTVTSASTTTFTVTFSPTSQGPKTAKISIANDDSNENPYEINLTGSGIVSALSDIINTSAYSYTSNVDYASYQTASTLTTGNSVGVNGLTIRDGGATTDADNLGTTLSAITFSTNGSTAIRTAGLFDGTTKVAEVAVNGATSIAFTGLTLSTTDDGTKDFELRVTYQSTVTDNQQITFTVTAVTATSTGSNFAGANAGAAASTATSDINRLEVTASNLVFSQQPPLTISAMAIMSPAVVIIAKDVNSNTDLDYTDNVSLSIVTGSTTFDGTATTTGTFTAGAVSFSNLLFNAAATSNKITATSGSLISESNAFEVSISLPEINIKQSTTSYATSSTFDFGNQTSGTSSTATTFTIENIGTLTLNLTGSPIIAISGTNASEFTINQASTTSTVAASGTTTFTITFNPSSQGVKTAAISISNDDVTGSENPYTINLTGTGTVSAASDIINTPAYSYSSNVDYASYQTVSTLTSGNSVGVNGLTLRDGGATTDADNLGTTLSALTFSTGGSTAIRTAALFDGTTSIAEVAVNGATSIAFSGLSLSTTDGGTKDFELRVTYQSTVTDNQQIIITVTAATAAATSSVFATANAGAATSTATSDINRIEVSTSQLVFSQQPSAVNTNVAMTPSVKVTAKDTNNNTDIDFIDNVRVSSNGTLTGSPVFVAAVNGVATFNTLTHTASGTGLTLLAERDNSGAWDLDISSNNFTVTAVSASTDYFRSAATGSWATPTSWESSADGSSNWITATLTPTSSANNITIRNGHTITISAVVSIDQVTVQSGGILTLAAGGAATIVNGTGDDITIQNGGRINYQLAPIFSSSTIRINGGGILSIEVAGLTGAGVGVNSTTHIYDDASILQWNIATASPSSSGVTFFPNVTTEIPILRFASVISGNWGASGTTIVNGKLEISSGISINIASSGTKTFKYGITGAGILNQSSAGQIIFSGTTSEISGTVTLNLGTNGLSVAGNLSVTGTLVCGTNVVSGAGSFTLASGATLKTANVTGINSSITVSGTKTFSSTANYEFNGSLAQVTGSLMPSTVNNLNINNSAGVTMSQSTTVDGTLTQTSGKLSIGTNTLTLNGPYVGDATNSLTGSATSNLTTTGTTGTLYFNQTTLDSTNVLKDLTISAGTTTLGNALNSTAGSSSGTVTVGTGATLTTGGNLTLKSDANGTAKVGITAGAITGNVTVERYIPLGKRAFRLLTPSVTTTSTIYNNWQIGGLTTSGRGTHITGSTTGANGFDTTASGNPSMFTYENNMASGTGWLAIPNTNSTALTAGMGYRTLVRGDRTVDISVASTDNMNVATTLSATGTLKVGDVVFDSSSTPALNTTANPTTNGFSMIGNPYASPVDWSLVTKVNVGNTYYTWDPNMGTASQRGRYVAYDITSGRDIPESAVSQYIQPGQAIFVKTTAASPVLTFKEADKATTFTNVFRTNESNNRFSISVYNPTEVAFAAPIDGTTAVFGTDFTSEIGLGDVEKLSSAGENIAWSRVTKLLAIDAQAPAVANDELLLKTMRFSANKSYTFKINATNFDNTLSAFLVDQYLNTQTQVDLTAPNFVTFATTTDAASYGTDRFKVVFSPSSALNNEEWNSKTIRIYPNPVVDNQFTIAVSSSITDKVAITIYNMIGQSVYKESAAAINNAIVVRPTALLKAGVYMVEMINNGKTSTQKIIIK
jgi:hypothetical protein